LRTPVVTAANEAFMPLLRGLVASLLQWNQKPFSDLAVFDVGLGTDSREWAARHGAQVAVPLWDLPVDAQLREQQPHLRAFTARVFLPRYFPGYDVYLWIDADAWVQERIALDWYFAIAAGGAMAVVPQVDRSYRHAADLLGWRTQRMFDYYGREAAHRSVWERYVNAGVFALRADAAHWKVWARYFAQGLAASNGKLVCDQTALNQALWAEDLPVHPLPALFNWLCHLGAPAFDRSTGKFREPFAPAASIGILHLTAHTKDLGLQVAGADGAQTISLRFPGSQ
jgi:lipopolysaccharide biosynthesis glycosyltransferase